MKHSPCTETAKFRLPADLLEKARAQAEAESLTFSALVRDAIDKRLEETAGAGRRNH